MPAGQPWAALDWHPPHPPAPSSRTLWNASCLHLHLVRLCPHGDDQEMNKPEVTAGPTSLPRTGPPLAVAEGTGRGGRPMAGQGGEGGTMHSTGH